jgi:hypothetical protein
MVTTRPKKMVENLCNKVVIIELTQKEEPEKSFKVFYLVGKISYLCPQAPPKLLLHN